MTSVNIDGSAVRALREEKDLTQLYLATVVGVTTDTISRWENRKYPSIKLENAEKLAQALDVPLEAILEKAVDEHESPASEPAESSEQAADGGGDDREEVKPAQHKGLKRIWTAAAVLTVVVSVTVGWLLTAKDPTVSAVRMMPKHTSAKLPFPVIVRLKADKPVNVPILLREVISGRATARGPATGTAGQLFEKHPRWIGRLVEGEAAFLYMVYPDAAVKQGEEIVFSGECVSGSLKKNGAAILGRDRISISNHHWADGDKDFVITDEEILNAYERYSFPGSIAVDFSEVEKLWLAGKYRWDSRRDMFVPE